MRFEFLNPDGSTSGPHEVGDILSLIRSGHVQPGSFVRTEGSSHWSRAERHEVLRHALRIAGERTSSEGAPPQARPQEAAADIPRHVDPGERASEPVGDGEPPRNYGVLRAWGRWLDRWGWLVVRVALAQSMACVVFAGVLPLESRPARLWITFIAFVAGLGFARPLAVAMTRHSREGKPMLLPVGLAIVVPLVLGLVTLSFQRTSEPLDVDALKAAMETSARGLSLLFGAFACLVLSLAGLAMVVVGEWVQVQADIGMNSWKRSVSP